MIIVQTAITIIITIVIVIVIVIVIIIIIIISPEYPTNHSGGVSYLILKEVTWKITATKGVV